jgi:L-serine deaminase
MNRGIQIAAIASLAVTSAYGTTIAAPVEGRSVVNAPDYTNIKTRADAERLARQGRLVKVHLFPLELGGGDIEENISYISPEAAAARALVIGTLKRFVKKGLINKMDVLPEYMGESFVPSRIVFHASHSDKAGGVDPSIEVW